MSPSWVATSRAPIKDAGDLDEKVKLASDGPTKKARSQLKAAKEATVALLEELDGPVNVTLSGFAQGKDETEPDQVHVVVVKA